MRIIRRHSTAWIAGLAYLLATGLSGLLHDHQHGSHSHAVPGTIAYSDGSAACDAEHEHDGCPSTPESDDDCLACRFVTQSAVVSVPLPEPTMQPIVAEVRLSAPRFFVEPVYSCALARAPPLG